MFLVTIDPSECFLPHPATIVWNGGVGVDVIDIEKIEVNSCGADFIINELEAQNLDAEIIAARRGENSEPLDKVLMDLGLSDCITSQ